MSVRKVGGVLPRTAARRPSSDAAMKMDYQKLLVEETPDALIATSADGKVLHWNRGAETTFGFASAEAVGRSLNQLIVPPDRLEEEQAIQRQALESGVATYESFRRKKDGSLIYV